MFGFLGYLLHAVICTYYLVELSKKRALLDPALARSTFTRMIEDKPEGHIAVFTDGSVDPRGESASSAFVIPQLGVTKSWSLNEKSSILTAELFAIKQALSTVFQLDTDEFSSFTIFTDSLSAIHVIKSPSTENRLAADIRELLASFRGTGVEPHLTWIPSHTGIQGNSEADAAANRGRRNPTEGPANNHLSAQELTALHRMSWKSLLVDRLKRTTTNPAVTSHTKFGHLPWHVNRSRRLQVCLFRLRSGHNNLLSNRRVWMREEEDDVYCVNGCPEEDDAEHVMLFCPEYSAQRIQLRETLRRIRRPPSLPANEVWQPFNLLGIFGLDSRIHKRDQFKIQSSVIQYIKDAGLYGRF